MKRGELQVLVATASLELGIDIGDVDLVCQIGSTRSINAFLQRVGRAGHSVGGTSKGRLFPLSRDELVECAALIDAVRRGQLDRLSVPTNALDVLAQQITAEVAAREWQEDELFDLVRRAYPYRGLQRREFDECVLMLAEGFSTRRGRRGALLHHDSVNKMLRPRKGARLTAITSGGAIPDNADYKVMLEPESHLVGTVNEDFAVESLQGDVFQLATRPTGSCGWSAARCAWRTPTASHRRFRSGWGEAPGRTEELSRAVSGLRKEIEQRLSNAAGAESAIGGAIGGVIGAARSSVPNPGAGRSAEPAAERNVELSVEGSADGALNPVSGETLNRALNRTRRWGGFSIPWDSMRRRRFSSCSTWPPGARRSVVCRPSIR